MGAPVASSVAEAFRGFEAVWSNDFPDCDWITVNPDRTQKPGLCPECPQSTHDRILIYAGADLRRIRHSSKGVHIGSLAPDGDIGSGR